jgi:enamine deaminase RidA (YjgF/YER057c/UK114 family)
MSAIDRIEVGRHLSHAAIHRDVVHLSGVVSPGCSVREQTQNVLTGIDELLRRAGTDKSRLLSATLWLTDIRDLDEVNRIWEGWVPAGCAPARECLEAKLSLLDFALAIAVTAAR